MSGDCFVVESKGHCFICLRRIPLVKVESKPDSLSPSSSISLHSLSRCVKLDMGKVFRGNEATSRSLLEKVQKSKLKVELCDECAFLIDKFSEQYRQLEKIKMELASSLNIIHTKFVKAEETTSAASLLLDDPTATSRSGWMGKLEVLNVLRKEAMQKCARKINGEGLPRIKVQNLTPNEVIQEKLQFEGHLADSVNGNQQHIPPPGGSDADMDTTNVKKEAPLEDSAGAEDDMDYDHFNSPMDDQDLTGNAVNQDEVSPAKINFTENGQSVSIAVSKREKHYTLNRGTRKYKCTACHKEFSRSDHADRHYKSIHLRVKYKCNVCEKEFSRLENYQMHHRSVHLGVRFKCSVCSKTFAYKEDVGKHQKTTSCRGQAVFQ